MMMMIMATMRMMVMRMMMMMIMLIMVMVMMIMIMMVMTVTGTVTMMVMVMVMIWWWWWWWWWWYWNSVEQNISITTINIIEMPGMLSAVHIHPILFNCTLRISDHIQPSTFQQTLAWLFHCREFQVRASTVQQTYNEFLEIRADYMGLLNR